MDEKMDKVEALVWAKIRQCKGRAASIHVKALIDHVNTILIRDPEHIPYDLLGDASMRALVKRLVEVFEKPIASCHLGYHIPQAHRERYKPVITIIRTMKSLGARLKAYRVAVGIDIEKQMEQLELDLEKQIADLDGGGK
jgi:hypothetical protein